MKKILLILILFIVRQTNSQTILSENFESPLIGWSTNGTICTTQNSVVPVSGSAMMSLGTGRYLETPNFTLPSGNKYVSFWLNSFNSSLFNYSITANLMQNSSVVINLGSWYSNFNNNSPWAQKVINLPVGYSGSGFSIQFVTASNSGNSLIFYIDDFEVMVGNSPVSVSESENVSNKITIKQYLEKGDKLLITSNSYPLNLGVYIYDTEGKKVFGNDNYEISSKENEFSLKSFNSGIYIIKILTKGDIITKKIVVD
ncbi:MAG: T9SS type A sorting domain-containing protein [Bacteroidota bacterium]|nr:T9SS type A sorting domain-containing protein [Bacteroidota bacterium]